MTRRKLASLMDRRTFTGFSAGALLGLPLLTAAQQAGKVWRIGFLGGGARPADGNAPAALRSALQALGYVEGKDIVYEARWAAARYERMPALAAELLALKVDLIMTMGGPAAAAAKQATSTIPIVVNGAGDVVETGLVASLARPGGNITGVNDPETVMSSKRLQLLKEVVPTLKRVAVMWNPGDQAMTLRYREIERAAPLLRVSIEQHAVREPADFDPAMAAINRTRPDALMMVSDALTNMNVRRVIDYAAAQRIPDMYENPEFVRGGGLMSFGSSGAERIKIVTESVAKILKGAKPSDIPMEQPNRYLLAVNLKTAKALGITVPVAVLLQANEVIE